MVGARTEVCATQIAEDAAEGYDGAAPSFEHAGEECADRVEVRVEVYSEIAIGVSGVISPGGISPLYLGVGEL